MKYEESNAPLMRVLLSSGVILVAALVIAQGLLMGFIPGPSPALAATEIRDIFLDRKTHILIGSLLQIICWSFYATWCIPIIMFIRKAERGMPILTYASLVNCGGGYVFFTLIPMTWAAMAFRIETLDAGTVQIMNDWVWFDWLYTWPSFSIWMFIIAGAILMDKSEQPAYPRWLGYVNIWSGLLIFPAGLIGFFKTGPFAYDGLISFWFDVFVFFGWMVTMTLMTFKAITAQEREFRGGARSVAERAAFPARASAV